MAIHFACPYCIQTISVDEIKARERIECPYCNRPIKVPAKSTYEAPPVAEAHGETSETQLEKEGVSAHISGTAKIAAVAKRHWRWLGPVIYFLIGVLLGSGSIWQYANLQLQRIQTSDQRVRVERELYERLQLIQNDALAEISKYIPLRDKHWRTKETIR